MPTNLTPSQLAAARALCLHKDQYGYVDGIDRDGAVLLHLVPGTEVNVCNAQSFVDSHNDLLAALDLATRALAAAKNELKAMTVRGCRRYVGNEPSPLCPPCGQCRTCVIAAGLALLREG